VEKQSIEQMLERIKKIDQDFDAAIGWGSWMVSCANERESLVNRLAREHVIVPHKNLARDAAGGRVS